MVVSTRQAKTRMMQAADDGAGAFEAAFLEHWSRVYGLLFRLVGDRQEAEDLALEVFWRLYRKAPEGGRDHNAAGWLYRVATNLGYNSLRALKRRRRYEEEAGRLALEGKADFNPDQEAERKVERDQVRRALQQIKPRSAQLLILRHSGFSYAEISTILQLAPASIGAFLARAEREFEQCYRNLEGS